MFLEREPGQPERFRATLVGGEFARRALRRRPRDVVHDVVTMLCDRGEAELTVETCLRLGDPALARRVVPDMGRPDLVGVAIDDVLDLATTAGDDTQLAELRGDLHYLRGSWDDAVAAYAEAARLGDPTVTRLARKRGHAAVPARSARRGRRDGVRRPGIDGRDPAEESQVLSWRAACGGCAAMSTAAGELRRPRLAAANGGRRRCRAGHRTHDEGDAGGALAGTGGERRVDTATPCVHAERAR